MKEKIKLRDTNWVIKIGVIGGLILVGIYTLYLLINVIEGFLA